MRSTRQLARIEQSLIRRNRSRMGSTRSGERDLEQRWFVLGGKLIVIALLAAFAVAGALLAARLPDLTRAIERAKPDATRTQRTTDDTQPRGRPPQRPRSPAPRPREGAQTVRAPQARGEDGRGRPPLLLLLAAGQLAFGGLALCAIAGALSCRRLRNRRLRRYQRYEIHLSNHDEAKPQDLEDMVEGIAGVLRALPVDRARNGQPFCAFEFHHGYDVDGQKVWTPCLLCLAEDVAALGGAICAAYPDVRVGHRFEPDHRPIAGRVPIPGVVMRFRKDRPFVYPLASAGASGRKDASPLIEAIAQMQHAIDRPSTVRLQITPAPGFMERVARHFQKRQENKLVRSESWGIRDAGLRSEQNKVEMRSAQAVTNRSIFYLEVQVAANDTQACKRIAAALQSRRGENRLRRRMLVLRANRYRRRFPDAYPPLLPSPRSFASAAELGFLLELPSARMKNVPARRITAPPHPRAARGPPDQRRGADHSGPLERPRRRRRQRRREA
jgi:hypothetical protein